MKKAMWSLLVALLIIPLALTACGKDKEDEKKSDDIKLSQTLADEASGITIQYPEGWVAKADSGAVVAANSQAALDSDKLGENDLGISVMVFPMEMLGATDLDTAFSTLNTMMAGQEGMNIGEATTVKIGGADAKRVTTSSPDEGDGVMFTWLTNDSKSIVVVVGLAPKGKMASVEPYALKIAESVKVAAPEG